MSMTELPTYEELDLLVDSDPIKLRDIAQDLLREVIMARIDLKELLKYHNQQMGFAPPGDNWLQLQAPDQAWWSMSLPR